MTKQEHYEIQARCEAATPGPWKSKHINYIGTTPVYTGEKLEKLIAQCVGSAEQANANADFIAHARQDISVLLDSLDTTESERDYQQARAEELESDLINERMNCEIMTRRAKALERAINKQCLYCTRIDKRNAIINDGQRTCLDCKFEFDEARFAGRGKNGTAIVR